MARTENRSSYLVDAGKQKVGPMLNETMSALSESPCLDCHSLAICWRFIEQKIGHRHTNGMTDVWLLYLHLKRADQLVQITQLSFCLLLVVIQYLHTTLVLPTHPRAAERHDGIYICHGNTQWGCGTHNLACIAACTL